MAKRKNEETPQAPDAAESTEVERPPGGLNVPFEAPKGYTPTTVDLTLNGRQAVALAGIAAALKTDGVGAVRWLLDQLADQHVEA